MGKSYTNGPGRNTIPRLELQAALDSVKLSRMVKQEMELFDCQSFFWTDFSIVLHSLHADCKRFSSFTRNRLQRILRHTKEYDWGYVGTKVNPADKLTRGMSTSALVKDSLWFAGPQFLLLTHDKWPDGLSLKPTESVYRCYDQPSNEQLDFSTGQNFSSSMAIVNVCCSSE